MSPLLVQANNSAFGAKGEDTSAEDKPASSDAAPAEAEAISLDDFRNFFSKLDNKEVEAPAEKVGKRRWKACQTREKVTVVSETTLSVLEEARKHLVAAETEDPTSGLMTARTADLFKQLQGVVSPEPAARAAEPESLLPPIRLSVSITTASSPDAIAIVVKDPNTWNLRKVANVYGKHAPTELQESGFEFVWRGVRLPMNESIESLELFGQASNWPCGTMRSVPLLALGKGSGLPMFGDFPASLSAALPSIEEQESQIPDTPKPAAALSNLSQLQSISAQQWDKVISTPRAAQTWLEGGSIPAAALLTPAEEEDDEEEDDDEDSDSDSEAPMLTISEAPIDDGFTTARLMNGSTNF